MKTAMYGRAKVSRLSSESRQVQSQLLLSRNSVSTMSTEEPKS